MTTQIYIYTRDGYNPLLDAYIIMATIARTAQGARMFNERFEANIKVTNTTYQPRPWLLERVS